MARVSIKMIAKELEVSNATVSLVLNGKAKEGRVSKALAEKILLKAKELNYEPNTLARSLRIGKSQTIGVVVADISNPFFGKLVFHIQEQAKKSNYTVIVANTNEESSDMTEAINTLRNRQVDGLIITPTENGLECIEGLTKSNIPFVLLDRWYPELRTNYVVIDNYHSAYNGVKFLMSKKCKKIAFIGYQNEMFHFSERQRGYRDAMKDASLFDTSMIKKVKYSNLDKDTAKVIDKLLEKDIDGIFFSTNSICVAAIKHIQTKDPSLFKRLKLMSFDYSEIFDFIEQPVYYISQPLPEMGKKAVDLLMNLVDSKVDNVIDIQTVSFQPELITRS